MPGRPRRTPPAPRRAALTVACPAGSPPFCHLRRPSMKRAVVALSERNVAVVGEDRVDPVLEIGLQLVEARDLDRRAAANLERPQRLLHRAFDAGQVVE